MKPPVIANKLQAHLAPNVRQVTAALDKAASTPAARKLVGLLHSSSSSKSAGFAQMLIEYLHDRLAAGETPDAFVAALKDRAEQEVRKRHQVVRLGQDLARQFKDPVRIRRLIDDVIMPAQRGQIDGRAAYSRTADILGALTPSTVAHFERVIADMTVAISVGAVAGALVGGEKTIGVAFHGLPPNVKAFEVRSRAVQLGTVEVAASLQFEFSVGSPNGTPLPFPTDASKAFQWGGWAMGIGVGGGDGVTGELSVAWTPNFLKPLYDWPFNSISVELGVGEGVDIGVCFQGSVLRPMMLLRKQGHSVGLAY